MNKKISDVLFWVSAASALVAGYVSMAGGDVFKLAGTQWMLIAIVLGVYAVYAKLRMS